MARYHLTDNSKYSCLIDNKIVKLKRTEFPRYIIPSKASRILRYFDWKCFWTDCECHYGSHEHYETKNYPWLVSLDHMCSVRLHRTKNNNTRHRLNNLCVTGHALNRKIGHIPLPLRLLHKQILKSVDYNRNDPTDDTLAQIRTVMIETENKLKLNNKYPWQPWSYDENDPCKKAANDFYQQMTLYEDNYLKTVKYYSRHEHFKNFKWIW